MSRREKSNILVTSEVYLMNIVPNINEKLYRHAKFLRNLDLNEQDTKLLRLFLKINQIFPIDDNRNLRIEDNTQINRKIAVEF